MIGQLAADEASRPELFCWNGPIPRAELDQWLLENGLPVPPELKELWASTGGGEFFESEIILEPYGEKDLGDDVLSANAEHRARGLGPNLVLFHRGAEGLTAVRLSDGKYVCLNDNDYTVKREFLSLSDWYERAIRQEYAVRYGLPVRGIYIRG